MAINAVLLALMAIGLGIFLIGMPMMCDDWVYVECMLPWIHAQGANIEEGVALFSAIPDFSAWFDWVRAEYLRWLPRFSNLISPLLLVWPKWFSSGVMWLCAICTFQISLRILNISWEKGGASVLLAAILGWFLPWYDGFGSLLFQLNYIVPTLLAVLIFYLLCSKRVIWLQYSLTFLTGVLLGGWHEGFGVPVLAALVVLFIIFKDWRRADVVIAGVGIASGLAFIWFSPGFHERLSPKSEGFEITAVRIKVFLCDTFSYWVGFLSVIAGIIISGWKKILKPATLFLLISGGLSVIVCFIFLGGPRVAWWADFCGSVLLIQSLVNIWPAIAGRYRWRDAIPIWIIALCAIVFWITVDCYVIKINRDYRQAISGWREDPYSNVFADAVTMSRRPLIIGRMPESMGYDRCMQMVDYTMRAGDRTKALFYLFPGELRDVTAESGEYVKDGKGARKVGEWFIMPGKTGDFMKPYIGEDSEDIYYESELIRTNVAAEIDFGDGWQPECANLYSFRSQRDGKYYTLIMPMPPVPLKRWYTGHFKKAARVRINASEFKDSNEINDISLKSTEK